MPSLAEINRQIDAYQHRYIFWTRKEIRALPEILDHDETIKAITSGIINNSTWLAVCTTRRLIFLNRGMLFGLQQAQFPLDKLQSIDHQFTVFFGSISVWDGASSFTLNLVPKGAILPFVRATEEAMHELRGGESHSAAPATDVATQLGKLVELKEKGYLTDEEFQAQKKKLLG